MKCSQHGKSNYEREKILMPFHSRIGMRWLFTSWSGNGKGKQYRLAVYISKSQGIAVSVFVSVAFKFTCMTKNAPLNRENYWKRLYLLLFYRSFYQFAYTFAMYLPCWYDRITVQPNEPNGTETAFQVSARHSDNFPFDNNVVQFKFQYKKRIVLKRAHKCTYTKFICMCTQHYSVVFRVDVMCLPKLTQRT